MKNLTVLLCLIIATTACQPTTQSNDPQKEEWINLFNGTDLTGWDIKIADHELNENYLQTFVVEDSMIRVRYDNYEEFNDAFGHLYYKEPFSYYKISFDYRFTGEQLKGGATWNVRNSGIMLHSQSAESNELTQDFPVSIELQLLGGLNNGERSTCNLCTPGTIVEMADTLNYNHCTNSISETYNGDQWVHAEAIVMGGESMTFIAEGATVLNFQQPQIGGGFITANNESEWEEFGLPQAEEKWKAQEGKILTEGYIALQAESHPVDFKHIKLLNLVGCMDPKATNYKSYFVKDDRSQCKY